MYYRETKEQAMHTTVVSPAMRTTILDMIRGPYKFRKLELIMKVKTMTGLGHKDTKDLVEAIQQSR
jgi:ribosomal protein L7/L12